jgi:DHA2 family multidrug resistance protein-like MFS transporter
MLDSTAGLPTEAADAASNSVGAAVSVGARLGGEPGQALVNAANSAFVNSMGTAFIIAAVITFVSAMAVLKFMPPRHLGTQDHAGGD